MKDPYESRVGDQWEVAERLDPVVWGNEPGPLDADTVGRFEQDGYLFMERLFDEDEVRQMQDEAAYLAGSVRRDAPGVIIEPTNDAVRSIFRLHRDNDLYRGVCRDPRIVDVVRQLLGSDVYVHQSRINYKPGFHGKEFFWHSDFETWHIEDGMPRPRAISVSIALTDNHEFNGPLMVIPRSHARYVRCVGRTPEDHYKDSLRKQEYGVPSQDALRELVEEGGIVAPKGPAGSVLFFECNLMHGSVGNLSPSPRTNLFVVFNSVENALVEPFGGQKPRPDFLAEREIVPLAPA